jgi:RHS repeat-associated protein
MVAAVTTASSNTYIHQENDVPLELIQHSRATTNRYWYELDGRGNVVGLTNSSGSLVDSYTYDLWGKLLSISETVPQQLRYAGYWYDNELGWYWLGTRAYDPVLERFLQPDLSQSSGLFSYVYANDDPLDSTDPTGEAPWRNCGPDMIYCGGMPGGEVDQPTNVAQGTPCYYNPDDCAWSPSAGASPANDPGGFASNSGPVGGSVAVVVVSGSSATWQAAAKTGPQPPPLPVPPLSDDEILWRGWVGPGSGVAPWEPSDADLRQIVKNPLKGGLSTFTDDGYTYLARYDYKIGVRVGDLRQLGFEPYRQGLKDGHYQLALANPESGLDQDGIEQEYSKIALGLYRIPATVINPDGATTEYPYGFNGFTALGGEGGEGGLGFEGGGDDDE